MNTKKIILSFSHKILDICVASDEKLTMKLGKSAKEEKSTERIKNFSCNLTQSVVISYMAFLEKYIWIGKR